MTTETDGLGAELDDLARRFPNLSKQDRFVLWFVTAAITGDEDTSAKALCGGAHDKGVDAVYVDDDARTVFVTQGKHREAAKAAELRNDVMALARLPASIKGTADAWETFATGLAADVRLRLEQGRSRVLERDYRMVLYYATTGRVASGLRKEAERTADEFETELEVLDGKPVSYLLRDYLDGIAPPVPSMDLGLESGEALSRHDPATGIDAWVVSAPAAEIAQMFRVAGVKVFARNVRGYMGATRINDAMKATLETEPLRFWYLNNGITIVCSAAKRESTGGRSLLRIRNPQIINGQQTTRVVAEAAHTGSHAAVLVRVFAIPSDNKTLYDELVSRIVRASNSQNQIKDSDLIANDTAQIRLERELRNQGYLYLRKRESVADAKAKLGIAVFRTIRKEQVAQAVAATILDPRVVRAGKEGLFRDDHYEQIFSHTTLQILTRWWFMQRVAANSKGYPNRAYEKWLVLHYCWQEFGSKIDRSAHTFIAACERPSANPQTIAALDAAIDRAFRLADAYFRAERGQGPKALDVSNFFYQGGRHIGFKRFVSAQVSAHKRAFETAVAKFVVAIREPASTR